VAVLRELRPDAIVHFAEQRAAPYSMRTGATKRYTVDNNVRATYNLLAALVETGLDAARWGCTATDGRARRPSRRGT
jgi:UDP-sulfoquinovose synthase